MRILGVTLARGGSKGIPRKNLAPIGGKALIDYTIDVAQQVSMIDDYVVSTDDQEIMDHCNAHQEGLAPFVRPDELASDTATSVDALVHAVLEMERRTGTPYDLIVEIMATNPLKNAHDIESCLNISIENDGASCIAVHRILDQHPARVKQIVDGRLVDFCVPEELETRRQDLTPPAYIRSGSIYVMSRKTLVDEKKRYDPGVSLAYVLPPERVVNIDEPIDLLVAQHMLTS